MFLFTSQSTAEQLSKAVKEEIHSKTVLESRTAAEGLELERDKVERQDKKNKVFFDNYLVFS